MFKQLHLQTGRDEWINITSRVKDVLRESNVLEGICVVSCPHTTAGITINENADPDVVHDLLIGLNDISPDRKEYRHAEGNSAAHLKASLMGNSAVVPITNGHLVLGIWQGIYFCEFDGPRNRNFHVAIIAG